MALPPGGRSLGGRDCPPWGTDEPEPGDEDSVGAPPEPAPSPGSLVPSSVGPDSSPNWRDSCSGLEQQRALLRATADVDCGTLRVPPVVVWHTVVT